jgi:Zn-dependent M28 family amino/carboxypeptidase
MLEVAKQLTGQNKQGVTRKNTIIFVSFDLEEGGKIN